MASISLSVGAALSLATSLWASAELRGFFLSRAENRLPFSAFTTLSMAALSHLVMSCPERIAKPNHAPISIPPLSDKARGELDYLSVTREPLVLAVPLATLANGSTCPS